MIFNRIRGTAGTALQLQNLFYVCYSCRVRHDLSTATIRELPVDERPREKLLARGPSALSDSELIAILLRTGTKGINAIALADRLLRQFGSFAALARTPVQELAKIHGVGSAKAIQLAASFALGSRLARERFFGKTVDSPAAIEELLGPEMRLLDRESLQAVLLDTKQRLLSVQEISKGSLNESLAHPREIFKPCITQSANAFVLVHNHPSGDPSPSEADLRLTRRLLEAARVLQISLLDHVIIGLPRPGGSGYYSFKEAGVIT
jgi:DNA repair protein RadC